MASFAWLRRTVVPVLVVACAAACAPVPKPAAVPTPDQLTLVATSFQDLPGWASDRQSEAVPAFQRSCQRLQAEPPKHSLSADAPLGTAGDWTAACAALAQVPPGDDKAARAYFETWLQPFLAGNNGRADGLFTGYYEAELRGSRVREGGFTVPLLRVPEDLVTVDLGDFRNQLRGQRIAGRVVSGRLRPYDDRARIAAGALDGRQLELLWVDDPVGAFFMQVQGSGRIVLGDGTMVRVGYAAQNGYPYVAIGSVLAARGEFAADGVSLQTIRAWLQAHPDRAAAIMNENPSYIFFRILDGDGPEGAEGVVLTPGRSLAVDHAFVPYGVPVWLDTPDPLDGSARLQRLLVAQDTGGAIRGPVRGDLFWGHGNDAEQRAGAMKGHGQYFLLIPRSAAPAS